MNLKLLKDVFNYNNEKITILYDIPTRKDNKEWQERRKLAIKWAEELPNPMLAYYDATYSNNADLPENCYLDSKEITFDELMSDSEIIIALTQFSATAPLHKYAKKYSLKIASMPGFNKKMFPALVIDYKDVAKKVKVIYDILNNSNSAKVVFEVHSKNYALSVDLTNRKPLKDDGICTKGKVINLPSGEAFIAPNDTAKSKTQGYLPIEKNGYVNIYEVKNNMIISAKFKDELTKKINSDPAVGNIAELAFGVLCLNNIKSCGKTLLDEKLGFHIALGRSDHFGGNTGPDSFKFKKNIWHQDYVYIKDIQPDITVKEVQIGNKIIIKNDKYTLKLFES